MFIAKKFRLNPTTEQEAEFRLWCAAVRRIYNAALEQRSMYYRIVEMPPEDCRKPGRAYGPGVFESQPTRFTAYDQAKQLSLRELRDDPDLSWISAIDSDCISYALRDLDKAFANFYRGSGFPTWRNASDNNSFTVKGVVRGKKIAQGRGWSFKVVFGKDHIKFPKIGRIGYTKHTKLRGQLQRVTIVEEGGMWFAVAVSKIEASPVHRMIESVGIDVGVHAPMALSTGEIIQPAVEIVPSIKRVTKLNRKFAKTRKGSNRRKRVKAELRCAHAKVSRQRSSFIHRLTTDITRRFATIAVENLSVKSMTASAKGTKEAPGRNVKAKSGLNREILNVSFHQIRSQLEYKAERTGGVVVAVDPRYTSQTCGSCGHVAPENRKGSLFECVSCNYREHADVNAARNILARATSGLVAEPR